MKSAICPAICWEQWEKTTKPLWHVFNSGCKRVLTKMSLGEPCSLMWQSDQASLLTSLE